MGDKNSVGQEREWEGRILYLFNYIKENNNKSKRSSRK